MMRRAGALIGLLVAVSCGPEEPDWPEFHQNAVDHQPPGLVTDLDELMVNTIDRPCGPTDAFAVALDAVDGSRRWREPIPAPPGPIIVEGGVVYVSGVYTTEYLPSVGALDADTGDARWQRFFDTDDRLGVEPGVGVAGVTVSGDGVPMASTVTETGDLRTGDVVALPPERSDATRVSGGVLELDGNDLVATADNGEPWWEVALPVDGTFSAVARFTVDDRHALVTIEASVGRNVRLVLVGLADGMIRWTFDGALAGELAGDRMIYGELADRDRGLPEQVVAVSLNDPNTPLWSRPSTGYLGGFVGSGGRVDWFASAGDPFDEGDRELIASGAAGPDAVALHGRWSGDRDRGSVAVTEELVVVGDQGGLMWRTSGGSTMTDDIQPIDSVAVDGSTIYAVEGIGPVGCD